MDRVTNIVWKTTGCATLGGFAYGYDVVGRRASTTTLEGTTRHVYDDSWQVVADLDEQQRKLLQLLRDYQNKNEDAWSKLHPCSHFASDVWNEITGENLEDRNFIGISLPSKLMESINEANAK